MYNTTQDEYNGKLEQQKKGSISNLLLLNHIFSYFFLETVNIVLRVVLFQPFKYQGLFRVLSKSAVASEN